MDHFLSLIKFRVAVGLEPILAVIGQEVHYTLDANSVYCRADTQTLSHLQAIKKNKTKNTS